MKFLPVLLALILSAHADAAIKGAPFLPEEDARFDSLENDVLANVGISRKYAKAIYDVNTQGGSSTSHDLGVVLPTGAVLTGLYVYVNTAFTQNAQGGSVALQCAGTNDLMAWQDMTVNAKDSLLARRFGPTTYALQLFGTGGSIVDTGATFTSVNSGASIPAACSVKAIVRSAAIPAGNANGGNPQLTGKFTAVLEYFVR